MKRRGLIGSVVTAVACLSGAAPALAGAAVAPAIVGGTSDGVPSTVARVSTGDIACSGVLVAPTLVATARHCVAVVDAAPFACDEAGRPIGPGGAVRSDREPATFRVEIGGATLGVVGVVDDGAPHLCAHDVALLVLAAPATVAPARLRLAGVVGEGEAITVAGFGLDESGGEPTAARARTIEVRRVGPRAATATARAVAPGEFETGEGGCDGDSGGPAFASDGAVVAVYSRGGNDGPGCAGPGARNVYTGARALVPLLARALPPDAVVTDEDGAPHTARDLASLLTARGCSFAGASHAPTDAPWSALGVVVLFAVGTRRQRHRRRRSHHA